jgi:aconitate hydratase
VLPLQFRNGDSAASLGLHGNEIFELLDLETELKPHQTVRLVITGIDGARREVPLLLRVDTPVEADYYRHGGILPYVLRQILAA